MELRDPLGRWISFSRDSDAYHSDIPLAEAERRALSEVECDDSDDSLAAMDTLSQEEPPPTEDRIRLPGPLTGDYLLLVARKPSAEWDLMIDGFGVGNTRSNQYLSSASVADTLFRYRLRWDLSAELPVQLDSLRADETVAIRPPWTPLRLPCEPDSFDSMPAADATIELRGGPRATLTVTMPDGEMYESGPVWITGGRRVTSTYTPYPALGFLGTQRGSFLIGVQANVTGTYTVSVSRHSRDAVSFVKRDSIMIRAGDTRYWHTSWSEPGTRDSRWIELERGPVRIPPNVTLSSTVVTAGAQPALSPDGFTLAFIRSDGVWRMDVATGRTVCVARIDRDEVGKFRNPYWPAWSPDGKRILFQAERMDGAARKSLIWSVGADGTGLRNLVAESAQSDQYPLWSPHGDRIVWTRGSQLWIADSAGARGRPLTQHPARVFERACEWSERDNTILYVASDGACDGPQYSLRRLRPDGTQLRSPIDGTRAEDVKIIPGTKTACTTDGRRVFVAPDHPGPESTMLLCSDGTAGSHRSRVAISPDGKMGFTDGDPFPNGEPAISKFELPPAESEYLVRRWRDGLMLLGTDSTTVGNAWGQPQTRSRGPSGDRVWSYSLKARGEREDGWLQFYFKRDGKLWSVTRGPQPVGHFLGYP